MKLSELKSGEKGVIVRVEGGGSLRKRITEMGFVRGQRVLVIKNAPLKDPIEYEIMGYDLSLRRSEAERVIVSIDRSEEEILSTSAQATISNSETKRELSSFEDRKDSRVISVGLVGNPNCGKTSLFNYVSGLNQHVGNYSGVTVDLAQAEIEFRGYTIKITDLPGTYSLASYSPEERYMQNYLRDYTPDVILNVIDGSNLERNLYLTTQLIDLDVDTVVALNMYDELQASGSTFNHKAMGELLGMQFVPTVAKRGKGVPQLLQAIVDKYEADFASRRTVEINYGSYIESLLSKLIDVVDPINCTNYPSRYVSIKLLEGDKEMKTFFNSGDIAPLISSSQQLIEREFGEVCETVFADARYGFISGALKETYKKNISRKKQSEAIDSVLTNKYFGIPIFLFVMWLIFWATFTLGEYPMAGIEWLVEQTQILCGNILSDGAFRDLLIDGILGGVGGVIVFLPNILLLFLFISFLEDSGYMSRAAFLMDKLMHKIGLHGKSFIPLIMGFGCNVPAVMATRIIEDKNNRLLTMLIVPFMSCSARLPVYILFVSAFFPENASTMLFVIYFIGALMAIFTSLLFKKLLFNKKDLPFVMELPPYRIPTARSIVKHMWQKGSQYLQKMGGIILVAVVIVWTLSYYPQKENFRKEFYPQIEQAQMRYESDIESGLDDSVAQNRVDSTLNAIESEVSYIHASNSYLGQVGKFVEPVFKPLGFDWKLSVGLLSGVAAKEIIVSTLGVLHNIDNGDDEIGTLGNKLKEERYRDGSKVYNNSVALSFLMFVLIYFPCIAVIAAIRRESGSPWWALLNVGYSSALAWIVSFIVYNIF